MAKQASRRRDRPVEETQQIFKEMQTGSELGLKNCLRFKIDPANDNGTLRDPVAYRCNLTPHLHTGTKYKVSPFNCTLILLMGILHIHFISLFSYASPPPTFSRLSY